MGFLVRWRRPLIVVLVLILLTVSLSLTNRLRGRVLTLQNLVAGALAPAGYVLEQASGAVAGGMAAGRHLLVLQAENQALRRQVVHLRAVQLELQQVLQENGRLRGLLALQSAAAGVGWKLVAADVVGRNPDTWFDTVVIDRGSRAGVRPGMAVIVPQGVVGRVVGVGPATATVMLVLDPQSGVGATDVRSQATGVVLGTSPVSGELVFQLFGRSADVTPGDAVVTSAYSQYFPPGLLLGQVVAVQATHFGLTHEATVRPAVNFDSLQQVLVVERHPAGVSLPPIYGSAP